MRPLVWITGFLGVLVLATPGRAQDKGKPVDLKPYEKFAAQFAESAKEGRSKQLANSFEASALVDRFVKGIEIDAEDRKKITAGMQRRLEELSAELINNVKGDGTYKVLRVRVIDGEVRALLRAINDHGGLNYHDYTLATRLDGSVYITDMYNSVSGESLSQSLFQKPY